MYSQYRDERAATYKLKLIYFDGRGRGEAIRLVLAAAQRDYEDERIPLGDKKWTDLKPSKRSLLNITVRVGFAQYCDLHALCTGFDNNKWCML